VKVPEVMVTEPCRPVKSNCTSLPFGPESLSSRIKPVTRKNVWPEPHRWKSPAQRKPWLRLRWYPV
jgi:hypothetical protein